MTLAEMLQAQLKLQTQHMKNGDPRDLLENDPEAWADFMRWNGWACEDELHEAMQEVGWKPWATSRHLNRDAFMAEMVDAFHFFMNMLLAASPGMSPADIAIEFTDQYEAKNGINAKRQQEGYTGTNKCPGCARDLASAAVSNNMVPFDAGNAGIFCSKGCWLNRIQNQGLPA